LEQTFRNVGLALENEEQETLEGEPFAYLSSTKTNSCKIRQSPITFENTVKD
jgi:hypothetical protein